MQVSFYCAIENLAAQVLEEEAETMMDGTEHWLRHIGISEDVQIRPGGTRQR